MFRNHSVTENIGVRYEVTDLLYLNATFNWDHESDPADLAENEDLTLLLGVGLEFE